MRLESRKLLLDIRESCRNIEGFLAGVDLDAYSSVRLLQAATEREFEIIGEAMNSLLRCDPDLAAKLTHARRIVDFRNLLAHGYAVVEDERVFRIVKDHLPQLLREVEQRLEEHE